MVVQNLPVLIALCLVTAASGLSRRQRDVRLETQGGSPEIHAYTADNASNRNHTRGNKGNVTQPSVAAYNSSTPTRWICICPEAGNETSVTQGGMPWNEWCICYDANDDSQRAAVEEGKSFNKSNAVEESKSFTESNAVEESKSFNESNAMNASKDAGRCWICVCVPASNVTNEGPGTQSCSCHNADEEDAPSVGNARYNASSRNVTIGSPVGGPVGGPLIYLCPPGFNGMNRTNRTKSGRNVLQPCTYPANATSSVVSIEPRPQGPRPSFDSLAACHILESLWGEAARRLGAKSAANCSFLTAFFTQFTQRVHDFRFPTRTLRYIPVWKAANMAIRCNLEYAALNATAALQPSATAATNPPDDQAFYFTVVREPLERFVSGYSEISVSFPKLETSPVCKDRFITTFESKDVDSTERVMEFMKDLLAGEIDPKCWIFWHVFSQLGPILDAPGLNYIGRRENFEAEWQLLSQKAGVDFPEFDFECGSHSSSYLNYPPRKKMQDLVSLKQGQHISMLADADSEEEALPDYLAMPDVKVRVAQLLDEVDVSFPEQAQDVSMSHALDMWEMKADVSFEEQAQEASTSDLFAVSEVKAALVCSVLLPDYVCLGYPLPGGPHMCVQHGFFSTRFMFKRSAERIKRNLCPHLYSEGAPRLPPAA